MFIRKLESVMPLSSEIIEKYNMRDYIYFDIETTGFDRETNNIILVSLGNFIGEKDFSVTQYFCDTIEDEGEVLSRCGREIMKYSKWCSYNGIAFDEPFIEYRMKKNLLEFKSPEEHVDLYRLIKPYHKKLGMERCNLKTVEKFAGITRQDKIDGGISVELYNKYIVDGDEDIKNIILLHNYEDVLNLPVIFSILDKIDSSNIVRDNCLTEKQLRFLKFLIKKNNIVLHVNVEKISKRSASKIIDSILKGSTDSRELNDIASN